MISFLRTVRRFTPLSIFLEFLPVAVFMTLESVGAPIRETDTTGMVKHDSQITWPKLMIGGKNKRAPPS